VQEKASNWELNRIALMDIILIKMALAELMEFPSIPVKVTLNEYIELSKYFSTPKSGVFINGILDKLIDDLKKAKKIVKSGRGLME
jgi:N utilization substance protein B